MKPTRSLLSFLFGSVFLTAQVAQAATYYWDDNAATAGFGVAGVNTGTWAGPTAGPVAGWSLSGTGADAFAGFTTSTTDILNFGNGAAGLGAGTITISGTVDAGNMTFASGSGSIVLSGGTINLAAAQTTTVNNATNTISSALSGAGTSFTKAGTGTLILTGANAYTGTTIINGGTLQVGDGTTGSLNGTTGTALTFTNTGTINFNEAAGVAQGMGLLTLTAGQGTIQSTWAGSLTNSLTFSNVSARSAGASVNFVQSGGVNGTDNSIILTQYAGVNTVAGALIDRGVFFNGDSYATANAASGYLRAYLASDTNASTAAAGANTITVASSNVFVTGAVTGQAAIAVNTLNLANNTLALTGALQTNGILASGGVAAAISGSTISSATGSAEMVIRVNASSNVLTISSVIQNNGTTPLTKSGDGTLILTGANTYTGTTRIGSGTLQLGNGSTTGALSTSSSIVIAAGGNLTINRSDAITQGTNTFANNITGAGSLTMSGSSTLVLSSNSHTGGFILNSGQVASIQGATYDGFGTGLLTINGGSLRGINTTATTIISNDILWNTSTVGFGRAGGGNPTWVLNGNVTLGGNVQTTQIAATEVVQLIFNGNVSDGGAGRSFTFTSGVNSVTFNGNNTFTGGINTNGNPLVVGGTGFLGGGNYSAAISSGGFTYSSSAAQNLSGIITASTLTKNTSTSSTLTLSGSSANVISGLTTVSAGTLELNKSGAVNAIGNNALTIGGANNTAATVRYTGASTDMMGTGAVTINGRGILDFNGKTDTIGNVAIVSTGATTTNPTPIINTAGSGNLTIGTLGITPMEGFTTLVNSGTGTLTLGGAVTFTAATTGQAQISGTALALGSAGRTFTVGLGTGSNQDLLIDAQITGAQSLTKAGLGRMTLSNTNAYTGGTTVSAGTLLLSGVFNMPGTGTLAVSNGGTFSLADGTARATTGATSGVGLTLATGSALVFDWNGGSLDSFTTTGTATSTGVVTININNTSPTGGGGILITASGASTLSTANYLLANNTNYTATISKTITTVSIGAQSPVTALTDAYWLGGQVTGALGAMTLSSGTTSNWASDAAGTSAGGVVPGGSAVNVIFGATGAAQQANVTTGTDINLGSITFNDTAAVTIAGSNTITLNSTSGTAAATGGALGTITNTGTGISAISVTSFANATNTISSRLLLGANQTWNVASGKTLILSGEVAGTNSLSKADAGTLILSGANTYTGGTSISAGTLQIGNGSTTGSLSTTGAIVNNSSLVFNRSNAVTQGADFATVISGTGTVSQSGSNTLTLNGTNTYQGGTIINAGVVSVTANANLGDAAGGITLAGGQLLVNGVNISAARIVTVNNTGSSIRVNRNNSFATSLALTGSGALSLVDPGGGGSAPIFNFSSASNSYTGAMTLAAVDARVSSLGEAAGNNIIFTGAGTFSLNSSGVTAGLTFTNGNRAIQLSNSSGTIQNNNATHAITIGSNLNATGAGAKTLTLDAVAGPTNLFSGSITNGIGGGSVAVTKSGAGNWLISGNMSHTGGITFNGGTLRLSGTNTYSGATNFNAAGITLIFAGIQAVSPNSAYVMNINGSTSDSSVKLLDDTSGVNGSLVTASGSTFTIQNSNAPGNAHTFTVGNNNTANGGTSSGTTTGSTIAINTLNWNTYAAGTTAYGPIQIQGTNQYRLQINNVVLHNAANLASNVVGSTFFTPTTANVTLGNVTVGTGNVNLGIQNLTLDGTSSDNRITGVISNASDFGTSNRALTVTKSNTSTWTLSGSNTYTGATTIQGGTLRLANTAALANTSGITMNTASNTLVFGTDTAFTTLPQLTGSTGAFIHSLVSDRATAGAGLTHALGVMNVGNATFAFTRGSNVTSGTAGISLTSAIMTSGSAGTSILNPTTATLTISGGVTSQTNDFTRTLQLDGTGTGHSIGGVITQSVASALSLTKSNSSEWTLSGASTYAGATTVNGGTLALGFGTVTSNILPASSALTMGGGTLQLSGAATSTQTVNGLTTTASTGSRILIAANKTLTLGALTAAGANSGLNFNTAAGGADAGTVAVGTSIATLTGGSLLNSWTVTDSTGFGLATRNGSNQIIRNTTTTLLPASGATSATNYRIDNNAGGSGAAGSSSLIVTADQAAASITMDNSAGVGVLTLNSGVQVSTNTWNFGNASGTNTYQITGNAGGAGVQSVASANTISINNYNSGTVTFTSPILAFGANALVFNGTGTTVLDGLNTYTGATTISGGGTLQIGANGRLVGGTYSGAITIGGGSTFRYSGSNNQILQTGAITGAGGITKDTNTSDLTLTGTNTYTGDTAVSAGRIIANAITGVSSGATRIVASGTGQFFTSAVSATYANNFNLSTLGYVEPGDATVTDGAIRSDGNNTFSGIITLSGNSRIGALGNARVNTISGQITGSGAMSFYGLNNANSDTQTYILSNAANNYSGDTQIDNKDYVTARTGNSTTLRLGASNVIPDGATAGNVAFGGASADDLTILDLFGSNETINGLSAVAATGARITNTAAAANSVLTIGANNTTSSFNGTITDSGVGRTLAITKTGGGTLALSGANTYVGVTTVSQGALLVNNTTGSGTGTGAVAVASGATLGGTGTIAGAVNVTGQLSPGASIETLGTGALALLNGSILVHELDSSVLTSVGSDLLKTTGNLDLVGTVGLTLDDLASTDVAFVDNDVFSLINYTGAWNNGLFTFNSEVLSDEEVFTFGLNTWKISYNDPTGGLNYTGEFAGGSDSFVNLTVVSTIPEPGAVILGSMGLLLILRRRR